MPPTPSADQPAGVGFIGPGQLGEPAVTRLLQSGVAVRVLVRRPEVADRLRAVGAEVTDDVQRCVAGATTVIVFLFSGEQLLDLALGPTGFLASMHPGSRLVVHTTISLDTLQQLAAAAAPGGVDVIDAPVSGTAQDIAAGRLTVLAGGPETAVAQTRALLGAYADPILEVGPAGSALRVKLLNNLLFAASVQLAVEAERVAAGLGLDPGVALGALQKSSAASRAMGYLLERGSSQHFGAGVAPYLRKDVDACRKTAAALGLELGLLDSVVRDGPLDLS